MANKPATTFVLAQAPIVDKNTGVLTWAGVKQLQTWDTQLNQGLALDGSLIGNLAAQVQIIGKPGTIGTITSNLDASGQVTADGIDFARSYLNKDTDHIADGSGHPLAGGKLAYIALSAPTAGDVLEWSGTSFQWVPRAQTIAVVSHLFLISYDKATGNFTAGQPAFTDISGTATAAQVPALSALTGQITTGQLPSSGISAVVALAKLTALGSDGSATFTSGILTAYSAPT